MIYDFARILLGIIYFTFGLNGFFQWWPLPPMNTEMMKFNADLQATKIIMPVVKAIEVVFGLLLILDRFTFLATLTILPISFFIIIAHLIFNRPKGFLMAGVFTVLTGLLVQQQWDQFQLILS